MSLMVILSELLFPKNDLLIHFVQILWMNTSSCNSQPMGLVMSINHLCKYLQQYLLHKAQTCLVRENVKKGLPDEVPSYYCYLHHQHKSGTINCLNLLPHDSCSLVELKAIFPLAPEVASDLPLHIWLYY